MKTSQSPVPKKVRKLDISLAFPEAVRAVIGGSRIHRKEWSDPQEYGLLKDSFLMIHREGKDHTWIVSEGDLLAIDWMII